MRKEISEKWSFTALVVIIVVLQLSSSSFSLRTRNDGKKFLVGFLDTPPGSGLTYQLVIAATATTSVTISSKQPSFTTITDTITAGTQKTFSLPTNPLTTTANDYTFYIEASDYVTVVAMNKKPGSADGLLVYPMDIPEATSFRVAGYKPVEVQHQFQVGIMAPLNNTVVYIDSPNGQFPTKVELDEYQGILLVSDVDETGTLITSNHPITVVSGNKCALVPSNVDACDHLFEQMMPIASWGQTFNTVPIHGRDSYDVFRAIADSNGTDIYVNGAFTATIDAGEYYEYQRLSTEYTQVTSSNPISLYQYCVGKDADKVRSDPFLVVIPSVSQYLSYCDIIVPPSYNSFISIVIKDEDKDGLQFPAINPVPTITWNQIGNSDYVGTSFVLDPESYYFYHEDPTKQFSITVGGFGKTSDVSYGFIGATRFAPIINHCVQTTLMAIDDGYDNDCDGLVDEEILNGLDEDGDGLIDEDLVSYPDCDDGNDCTYDYFNGVSCESVAVNDASNIECDDEQECSVSKCISAVCTVIVPEVDCEDGSVCTTDYCNSDFGCITDVLTGPACNDENVCTTNDACVEGVCQGDEITCEDENECTENSCDPLEGCFYPPLNGTACDDGLYCTLQGVCITGVCNQGPPRDCDDGNECTTDSCNEIDQCVNEGLSDIPCDDGDACTENDTCFEGLCDGTQKDCDDDNQCTNDYCDQYEGCISEALTGEACSDGNACTDNDTCNDGGECIGTTKNCGDGNQCTADSCDPDTGCVNTNLNGTSCNDSSDCTENDVCTEGVCGGSNVDCDDGNVCTDDGCNPVGGCTHVPNTDSCDDGNACTENDECSLGTCSGSPKTCDDSNQCTDDLCDADTGCYFPTQNGTSCDDSSVCTEGDVCIEGSCTPGEPKNCDDSNFCTTDSCDSILGCQHDSGDMNGVSCDDGDECTENDSCSAGVCEGTPKSCDDSDPCTSDSCDSVTGCEHNPSSGASCDDGDGCTENDECNAGVCEGSPKSCDDSNECTDDSCSAGVCQHDALTDNPCDDNNACTENDKCSSAGGCSGTGKTCDDGNTCTADSCNPSTGCVFNPTSQNGVGCNDNNLCTLNDICSNGVCSGTPKDCSDGDVCTADNCTPATGACSNPALTNTPCDDGNRCTSGDTCQSGTCTGGSATVCNDNDQCTTDSCDSDLGCVHQLANGIPCNDNNFCTTGDTCVFGECVGSGFTCDDHNDCTVDYCDPSSGCSTTKLTGTVCNDGSVCTDGDRCDNGVCKSGSIVNCNDRNDCTDDSCDAIQGCKNVPNDGNSCNSECTNSQCSAGVCTTSVLDRDCDFFVDCNDQCKGVDDRVDMDHDNRLDCLYPPADYAVVKQSWKCTSNKAYVCSVGTTNSRCIKWTDVPSYLATGNYYFGKCYTACREN